MEVFVANELSFESTTSYITNLDSTAATGNCPASPLTPCWPTLGMARGRSRETMRSDRAPGPGALPSAPSNARSPPCLPRTTPAARPSAIAHSFAASSASTRLSHGSKLFHPVTCAYTLLRAYTPRSGLSGKVHSPALKQKPWSMNVAAYLRSLARREKTACRPLQLPCPLVDHQHPGELRQVAHLHQLRLGQIIHHLSGHQPAYELAAELQPARHRST